MASEVDMLAWTGVQACAKRVSLYALHTKRWPPVEFAVRNLTTYFEHCQEHVRSGHSHELRRLSRFNLRNSRLNIIVRIHPRERFAPTLAFLPYIGRA